MRVQQERKPQLLKQQCPQQEECYGKEIERTGIAYGLVSASVFGVGWYGVGMEEFLYNRFSRPNKIQKGILYD